jgi:hypothetical protein
VPDPLLAAVGIGLVGSVVAGPAVAYGLQLLPQQWRRTTEWLLIAGAVVVAVLADLLSEGPVGGAFVYVLAALPGLIAFLAWRTLVASTFVSLAPLYFVIALLTDARPADVRARNRPGSGPLAPTLVDDRLQFALCVHHPPAGPRRSRASAVPPRPAGISDGHCSSRMRVSCCIRPRRRGRPR